MEVSASKESWKALRNFFVDNNKQFNDSFYRKFILPGFMRSIQKSPRGRHAHANAWKLEQKLGLVAPYSFSIIDYCLKKKPSDEWPIPLTNLVREFKAQRGRLKSSHLTSYKLTAFLMEQKYGDERRKVKPNSVAWTGDVEGFKRAYLAPHADVIKCYQDYIKTILDHPTKGLIRDLELSTDNPPLDFLFNPKHISRLKSNCDR